MTERADLGDGERFEETVERSFPGSCNGVLVPICFTDENGEDINEDGESPEPETEQILNDNRSASAYGPSSANNIVRSISPRPLVRKTFAARERSQNVLDDELMSIIKHAFVQDYSRREEEGRRHGREREEESVRGEEDRAQPQADARRHDQVMDMMMLIVTQGGQQNRSLQQPRK